MGSTIVIRASENLEVFWNADPKFAKQLAASTIQVPISNFFLGIFPTFATFPKSSVLY